MAAECWGETLKRAKNSFSSSARAALGLLDLFVWALKLMICGIPCQTLLGLLLERWSSICCLWLYLAFLISFSQVSSGIAVQIFVSRQRWYFGLSGVTRLGCSSKVSGSPTPGCVCPQLQSPCSTVCSLGQPQCVQPGPDVQRHSTQSD